MSISVIRRKRSLLGGASLLLLSVALGGAAQAQTEHAQVQLRPAQNQTIPTLGGNQRQANPANPANPASADIPAGDAFRDFLRAAHPVFARLSWQEALPNLEVLAINGFPVGSPSAARIAPEYVALDVALALPFKSSTLTARRAYLLEDHLVLRGMRLENDSGQLEADFAVLSRDALTLIGQYLSDQRPDGDAPALSGQIVLDRATVQSRDFAGDRPDGGFASSMTAQLLTFSGMTWGEGEDGPILLSGMTGVELAGVAQFAGRSDFRLARLSFDGSIPDVTQALLQRMGRGPAIEAGEEQEAAEAAPAAAEDSGETQAALPPEGDDEPTENGPGETASAASASASQEPAPQPAPLPAPLPVTHPFALSFSDLHFTATREGGQPARIAALGGAVHGSIEEGGAMQIAARMSDLRSSATVFAGTPLEELTREIAQRAGGSDLRVDIAMEAGLDSDRLRLNVPCIALPGLVDFATEIDVYVPGLERMLTQSGGRSDAGLDLLFASQARALSIQLVDHGLNSALEASGIAPLGRLVQDTLLSRLDGQQGGMRMMVLQSAMAPFTALLDQYDQTGAVALGARFENDTTLPVALVTFLQSSTPVTNTGAPDTARCDAVPLPG